MLRSDRILADVDAIYLPVSNAADVLQVEGVEPGSRRDNSFTIAEPLNRRKVKEEQASRLVIYQPQLKAAKKRLKARRRRNGAIYRYSKNALTWAIEQGVVSDERELIFLFLLTGIIFQIGVMFSTYGLF